MANSTGSCKLCGSLFQKTPRGKPYLFCSRTCAVQGRSGPSKKQNIIVKCLCGTTFTTNQSKLKANKKYCSRQCAAKFYDKTGTNNPNYKNAGWRNCEACDSLYHSYDKNRRYCGTLCAESKQGGIALGNQRRGYDAELKCFERLLNDGFLPMRSAASKGPFDVVGFSSKGTYFVQVKRTKLEARKKFPRVVKELSEIIPSEPCAKQIWVWVDRKGWFFIHINKDGTTEEWWDDGPQSYQKICKISGEEKRISQFLDIELELAD